jgi:hypothetical protein
MSLNKNKKLDKDSFSVLSGIIVSDSLQAESIF